MYSGSRKVTENILRLTLEIIYLLTGEDYGPLKTPSDHVTTSNNSRPSKEFTWSPIPGPPPPSLTSQENKRILEITQKMTGLLTGEVPIRCQDVTVYFSMEEWEYLEGHKDLYKDVMMEDHQTLTSPDGSGNGNPERCPHPLYSQDSTQGDQEIPQHHQSLTNPPKRYPRPLCSQDSTHESQEIPLENQAEDLISVHGAYIENTTPCKEEEIPPETSTDKEICRITLFRPPLEKFKMEEDLMRCSPVLKTITSNLHGDPTTRMSDANTPHLHSDPITQDFTRKGLPSDPIIPQNHLDFTTRGLCLDPITPHPQSDPTSRSFCLDPIPVHLRSITRYFHPRLQSNNQLADQSNMFSCPECGKCFTQESVLIKHRRKHMGKMPHVCLECGKAFKRKSQLENHQRVHTGEKPFTCDDCGKSFPLKTSLVKHQRIHSGEKPFSCLDCGKSFAYNSLLLEHQKVHTGNKPFLCPDCGKCFPRNAQLVKHCRTHTGERPFPCNECGKYFAHQSILREHLKVHTGARPYLCTECGRSFSRKTELVKHQRIHTGEKPYACPQCGKCFRQRGILVTHLKAHTGEKPYSCPECGKCFKNKSNLVKHQSLHVKQTEAVNCMSPVLPFHPTSNHRKGV